MGEGEASTVRGAFDGEAVRKYSIQAEESTMTSAMERFDLLDLESSQFVQVTGENELAPQGLELLYFLSAHPFGERPVDGFGPRLGVGESHQNSEDGVVDGDRCAYIF